MASTYPCLLLRKFQHFTFKLFNLEMKKLLDKESWAVSQAKAKIEAYFKGKPLGLKDGCVFNPWTETQIW
jgi:hypothetical protein